MFNKLPVSATLAPLSTLAILLLLLADAPSPGLAHRSELDRLWKCNDVRGLNDGPRALCSPYVSTGETSISRSRLRRGIGTGATVVWILGDTVGLPSTSPNEDDREGGGTDGYVSSRALGSVPPPFRAADSEEAGVVMLVELLVDTSGGENGYWEDIEAEAEEDEGGVEERVSGAREWDGR